MAIGTIAHSDENLSGKILSNKSKIIFNSDIVIMKSDGKFFQYFANGEVAANVAGRDFCALFYGAEVRIDRKSIRISGKNVAKNESGERPITYVKEGDFMMSHTPHGRIVIDCSSGTTPETVKKVFGKHIDFKGLEDAAIIIEEERVQIKSSTGVG